MIAPKIKFCWLNPERDRQLALPGYHSDLAAGMDIRAALVESITISPMERVVIPSGFSVEIPPGFELQVRPRSGMAITHGVTVINSPGTIDADYRGEVKVGLINLSNADFQVNRGDRIAQLVMAPVCQAVIEEADELSVTSRQDGGFGHTGIG